MDTKKPRGIIFHKKFIEAINQSEENPYDVHIKGLKYDKVKEQGDELLEALKKAQPRIEQLINRIMTGELRNRLTDENIEILQLIKNCEND